MEEPGQSGPSRGCPPLQVSERGRQCSLFILIMVSLLLCQMALALLGLSFYVRPYLQQHHLVTGQQMDSDLFPYGLIAASTATLVSSSLAVMSGVSTRQRRRSARRAAVKFGYFYLLVEFVTATYLLALSIVFILQVKVFELAYQRGFTRAMWSYMEDQQLKEYLDGVQQSFACCGSQGYSDWFVVDWYPRQLYQTRYKWAATQRSKLSKEAVLNKDGYKNASSLMQSFSMGAYGTKTHADEVIHAMDYEFTQGGFVDVLLHVKATVRFAEVPFSCCDPSSPTWCHQMYANYPWYNYDPGKRLGIHHAGCTYKVKSFLSSTVTMLVALLLVTMGLKCVMMILFRFIQTSTANALAVGRHLSPAQGYLMPLPGDGGAAFGDEEKPLLEGDATEVDSDATSADTEDTETLEAEAEETTEFE